VEERILLDERPHGIVLVRPFARALLLAAVGIAGFELGWPASVPGAVLLVAAAVIAFGAVLRWDRTHIVLTSEQLLVEHGVVRRTEASVRLAKVAAVEIDQSLLGRLLGYRTVAAGDLEIDCVPKAFVERLMLAS
jgi:uncharacterized membrane protein YdbT with pleckstrin-like domain